MSIESISNFKINKVLNLKTDNKCIVGKSIRKGSHGVDIEKLVHYLFEKKGTKKEQKVMHKELKDFKMCIKKIKEENKFSQRGQEIKTHLKNFTLVHKKYIGSLEPMVNASLIIENKHLDDTILNTGLKSKFIDGIKKQIFSFLFSYKIKKSLQKIFFENKNINASLQSNKLVFGFKALENEIYDLVNIGMDYYKNRFRDEL